MNVRRLLCFLILGSQAHAAVLARWEAGAAGPAGGISLLSESGSEWTLETGGDGTMAVLKPVNDYFRRASFLARIDRATPGPAWLTVEYHDRGYGVVSIAPDVPQSRQWGVARLNTGGYRRAVFGLGKAGSGHRLRLYGAPRLKSIELTDTEPAVESAPLVEPAIRPARPMQLVTTAGADARSRDGLPEALATLRNLLPLARALGFNGIESYVKWDFVERSPSVFDWSFYDAVVAEIDKHGLQWFPLLIVGSAYTLPDWYHSSKENVGFECLEHRMRNDIQSIFCENQVKYVQRFLREFGKHYASRKVLLGVRLGPSGNYGEAQYPARGDWGYKWGPMHTHIGYWAADPHAQASFRNWLRLGYPSIGDLNKAWGDGHVSFDRIETFLPATAASRRKRIDFSDWYMGAMSDWCRKWAAWAKEAMPRTAIFQSSGGWGPIEIGTDYTRQASDMAKLKGGIRLTNESDNFADNFSITRMASSAARFYGAALGYEPGGFGSARGVVARLFNCLTNGGEHLFYYHGNLYANDQGIDAWLQHATLLDRRAKPLIEVAAFYPDTSIKLDDEPVRFRWGSVFLMKAQALRAALDYDYVSEQMIEAGALERYKVLVFLWGHITEKPVLERIARWVEAGGTLIYPERPRGLLETVEGDLSVSRGWREGETGDGRVIFYAGDPIPGDYYARFVRGELRRLPNLSAETRRALGMDTPERVYWSLLEGGRLALLNFGDEEAAVRLHDGRSLRLAPYSIAVE